MAHKHLARHVLTLVGLILSLIAPMAATPVRAAPLRQVEDFSILLGRPTDQSVTVNVIPAESGEISFEYGTSTGVYGSQTSAVACIADEPIAAVIDGLASNTEYFYRLRFRASSGEAWTAGQEHSFHTQRATGSTFMFTITSDSHVDILLGNASTWTQTMTNVANDHPDFEIDLGDTFAMDNVTTAAGADQAYLAQRQYFDLAGHSAPIFLAIGNHEEEEGWHLDDTGNPATSQPVLGANARKKYYPNPVPDSFYSGNTDPYSYLDGDHMREDYYAWEWGDALFVVIDPFWYTTTKPFIGNTGGGEGSDTGSGDRWDWTLGLTQFNWLKQTLQNSTATYKFIFAHHMVGGSDDYVRGGANPAHLVEWGGYNEAGTTYEWATKRPVAEWGSEPVHQILVANHVSAFFHGHDHQYAYEKRDGIVYQSLPAAGFSGNGFNIYTTGDGYTIQALPSPGHLRVTVNPTQATVDYIATSGEAVNYSYTIEAETSGPTHDLTIAADPAGSGTTNPASGTHAYAEDTVVDIAATPAPGYVFDHWSGDCSGSGACQVTMDADKSVVAHFVEAPAGAITYIGDIGSVVSKTSGTSLVVNTTAPVSAGDDIIIAYATDPSANIPPITISDSAGNTYSEVGLALNTGQLRTYMFAAYDVNPLPAGSSITITASAAVTARAAVVSVFRGLADEDPLDQTSTGTGSSATPSSGVTATTTQADELLVGVIGTEGPDGDAAGTWANSFSAGPRLGTTGGTADTNITVSLGWRIVSETGAYTAQKSGITDRDWAAMIATFKAGPSGPVSRITVSGTPLSAFSSLPGTPSVAQSYTVSGSNLTDDVIISAPSDFQISLTSDGGFGASLTLPQSGGGVTETPIYVRFNRATEGTSSGNITHTSTDATTRNVAVSGTAAPLAPVSFNILLGRPTDDSVTANIIPDTDAEFYIEYGTSSGDYSAQTGTATATADEPIELVIGNLSANTEYFYHIVYRQTGTTEWNEGAEHSFETQRAPGSTFTFTIISDSHLGQYGGQTADEKALYEQTLLNVGADQPDFHLDLGDTFAMDPSPLGTGMTEAEAEAAYLVERPFMGLIGDSVPIYLAIGNHENEEGWNFDDVFAPPDQSLARVGLKYRKLYYPNPVPDDFYSGNTDPLGEAIGGDTNHEDYYAWQWGDALFVVLDPYHYSMTWPGEGDTYGGEGQDGEVSGDRWDWTLGIEQYLWLKDTLENSDAQYKFVFSHHVTGGSTPYGRGGISAAPYFEWGGYNADDTWGWDTHRPASEGWDVPIHQLMVDNGVDVYFHGHDHIYAREALDGIVYLECPKPDDAGYAWEPYGYGETEGLYPDAIEMIPNSGHIRVTVSPAETTIEYVRAYLPGDGANGEVADSVTILANPPNDPPDPPALVAPADGSTDVDTAPTLEVTVSDPDGDALDVTFYGRGAGTGSFASLGTDSDVASGSNASITWPDLDPDTGYEWYVEVSDGNATTDGSVWDFTTASTAPTCYDLTLNHTGQGSTPVVSPLKSAACATTGQYVAGEDISLSGATPSTGWHIAGWVGTTNDSSTAATNSLTMPADAHTVSVTYVRDTVSLTVNTTGSGSVTRDPTGPYLYGDEVELTAVPETGWHFDHWTGDLSGTANPRSITMDEDKTVTATFEEIPPKRIFLPLILR